MNTVNYQIIKPYIPVYKQLWLNKEMVPNDLRDSLSLLWLTESMAAVEKSYTPSPYVEFVDTMYDVRSWLDAASPELHNITNPHCFVLKEASNGDIVLKYKHW